MSSVFLASDNAIMDVVPPASSAWSTASSSSPPLTSSSSMSSSEAIKFSKRARNDSSECDYSVMPNYISLIIQNTATVLFIKSQSKDLWFAKKKKINNEEQLAKLNTHLANGTLPSSCKQRPVKTFDDDIQKKFDDARKNYEKNLLIILIEEKTKEVASSNNDFVNMQNVIRANIKMYIRDIIKSTDTLQLPNNAGVLIEAEIWDKIQQFIRETELNRLMSSSQKRVDKQIAHNKIAQEKQIIEQNVAEAIINQKNPNNVKVMIEEVMEAKFNSFAEKNLVKTIHQVLKSSSSTKFKGILKNTDSNKNHRKSRHSRSTKQDKSPARSQSTSSRDSFSSSENSESSMDN